MSKKITISLVEESDLKELIRIGRQTFVEAFGEANTSEDMDRYLKERFSADQLLHELNHPESLFYFASIDQEIVGYLKVNTGEAQTEPLWQEALEIERIYVIQEYLGKGVGKVLFDKAIQIAKNKKIDQVWLGVWDQNPRAIRFYEKNGFKVVDKHSFKLGSDVQTDIIMLLNIDVTIL